jgi:hypothetical protein
VRHFLFVTKPWHEAILSLINRLYFCAVVLALGISTEMAFAEAPAPAPAAQQPSEGKDPAIGQWLMEGRVLITLEADHTITGGRHGTWRYNGIVEGGRDYELKWNPPKDWSDWVNISADGKSMNGHSRGKPIAYLRPPESAPLAASAPKAEALPSPAEVLAKQAPNALEWALSPLDRPAPPDIRENLTLLREDLLDEAAKKPAFNSAAYKLGQELCNELIGAFDERDKMLVRAGYTAAQARANMGEITNQALEARRRFTNWPTYQREKDQRNELRKEKVNGAELEKQRPVLEWADRGVQIRRMVDALYAQYREATRRPLATAH